MGIKGEIGDEKDFGSANPSCEETVELNTGGKENTYVCVDQKQ